MKLQEESGQDGEHVRENIAWIAIEPGSQIEDYVLEAGSIDITSTLNSVSFENTFADLPAVFSNLQSIKDSDPGFEVVQNVTTSSIDLSVQGELASSGTGNHTGDQLAYLALPQTASLTDARGDIIGEVGTIDIDLSLIHI